MCVIEITNRSQIVCFVLAMTAATYSLEIRPEISVFSPSKVAIARNQAGVNSESSRNGSISGQAGVELTVGSEIMPVRYGVGLGLRSPVDDKSLNMLPFTCPIWVTAIFGQFQDESWFSPFLATRAGWVAPISTNSQWWNKPLNFHGQIGLGFETVHGIALEALYDYTSILKTFSGESTSSRLSSGRVDIQLSWGFSVGMERSFRPGAGPRVIEDELQNDSEPLPSVENFGK
jgi:hypothetical protein